MHFSAKRGFAIACRLSVTINFTDQYAFCPTGSTAAALISIFATITSLLACNDYVVVVALDFSKAFDTIRHSTLAY